MADIAQLLWHLLSDDKTVWQLVDGVVRGQLLLATAMASLLQVTCCDQTLGASLLCVILMVCFQRKTRLLCVTKHMACFACYAWQSIIFHLKLWSCACMFTAFDIQSPVFCVSEAKPTCTLTVSLITAGWVRRPLAYLMWPSSSQSMSTSSRGWASEGGMSEGKQVWLTDCPPWI